MGGVEAKSLQEDANVETWNESLVTTKCLSELLYNRMRIQVSSAHPTSDGFNLSILSYEVEVMISFLVRRHRTTRNIGTSGDRIIAHSR